MTILAVALGAFAAGAAVFSLIQNNSQNSNIDSYNSRLSSVCTAVKPNNQFHIL